MKSIRTALSCAAAGVVALSLSAHAASPTTATDTPAFKPRMSTELMQLAQRNENPGGGMFRNENPGGGMYKKSKEKEEDEEVGFIRGAQGRSRHEVKVRGDLPRTFSCRPQRASDICADAGVATIKWRLIVRSPGSTALDDGVGVDDQLPGAGDEGRVVRLSACGKTRIERDQRLVPAEGRRQGCGKERAAQACPSTCNPALPFVCTAVVIERGEPRQAAACSRLMRPISGRRITIATAVRSPMPGTLIIKSRRRARSSWARSAATMRASSARRRLRRPATSASTMLRNRTSLMCSRRTLSRQGPPRSARGRSDALPARPISDRVRSLAVQARPRRPRSASHPAGRSWPGAGARARSCAPGWAEERELRCRLHVNGRPHRARSRPSPRCRPARHRSSKEQQPAGAILVAYWRPAGIRRSHAPQHQAWPSRCRFPLSAC